MLRKTDVWQRCCFGLQKQVAEEYAMLKQAMEEERFRSEQLEEQINDLTELHQHEITNIKQVQNLHKVWLVIQSVHRKLKNIFYLCT